MSESVNSSQVSRLRWLRRSVRWVIQSPVPLLVLSVAVNVSLATRVTTLNAAVKSLEEEGQLQAGAKVPQVDGTLLNGASTTVRFDESAAPTLLYVMRPTCSWCQRNNANLRALISGAGTKYRVVVLSLVADGTEDYKNKYQIDAPFVTNLSEQTKQAYHLGGTPQTILVSNSGVVVKDWVGAYTGHLGQEVSGALQISFPGLLDLPKPTK